MDVAKGGDESGAVDVRFNSVVYSKEDSCKERGQSEECSGSDSEERELAGRDGDTLQRLCGESAMKDDDSAENFEIGSSDDTRVVSLAFALC